MWKGLLLKMMSCAGVMKPPLKCWADVESRAGRFASQLLAGQCTH